eukprot:TRINITY_DN1336_c1_g1_i2.p2 TRINITY_DN1336_c1_g1~~TRINITY_DN1336_c1_g1_i2.p2  ORF type:complete len:217 (-),score=16.52 TRINITY_DN1336_c1_g1_i2:183-833(-)
MEIFSFCVLQVFFFPVSIKYKILVVSLFHIINNIQFINMFLYSQIILKYTWLLEQYKPNQYYWNRKKYSLPHLRDFFSQFFPGVFGVGQILLAIFQLGKELVVVVQIDMLHGYVGQSKIQRKYCIYFILFYLTCIYKQLCQLFEQVRQDQIQIMFDCISKFGQGGKQKECCLSFLVPSCEQFFGGSGEKFFLEFKVIQAEKQVENSLLRTYLGVVP